MKELFISGLSPANLNIGNSVTDSELHKKLINMRSLCASVYNGLEVLKEKISREQAELENAMELLGEVYEYEKE